MILDLHTEGFKLKVGRLLIDNLSFGEVGQDCVRPGEVRRGKVWFLLKYLSSGLASWGVVG